MKIEVAPWIKEYVTEMDNLYTDLTVEHFQEGLTKITYRTVKDYREIFKEREQSENFSFMKKLYKLLRTRSSVPIKVFGKGDPGMGKTTLSKKIAWDWAKRSFTRFSLVFLVFLKLVNPGDAIENVIIQQTPPLERMSISPCKILQILNKFGSRCLLILDGFR